MYQLSKTRLDSKALAQRGLSGSHSLLGAYPQYPGWLVVLQHPTKPQVQKSFSSNKTISNSV